MALLKNVPFAVAGTEFMIETEETSDYILNLAKAVDTKISVYLRMGSKVSLSMASILTAMEYCDEYTKQKADIENMRAQLRSYIDEAQAAHLENSKLRADMEKNNLTPKLSELENENYQLRQQIGKLVEQISNDDSYLTPGTNSQLESENRRLCDELEKANAFIEQASRYLNERDELSAQLAASQNELAKVKTELEELEREIVENY